MKLEQVKLDQLGRAKKVVIAKETTTIIEGAGTQAKIKGRIAQIKREIDTIHSGRPHSGRRCRYWSS